MTCRQKDGNPVPHDTPDNSSRRAPRCHAARRAIHHAGADRSPYNRALAAGYKALFLCSAIANAERNGTTRTPESVEEWELAGIQQPLSDLIGDMNADIIRSGDKGGTTTDRLSRVEVRWAEDMPPRLAYNGYPMGCTLAPIGYGWPEGGVRIRAVNPGPPPPAGVWWQLESVGEPVSDVIQHALNGEYGEGSRTTAIAIARDGKLVAEEYDPAFDARTPQRTWSVAKSIAATLAGVAVQRGGLTVEASAELGPVAYDPRRQITIDDLLRMASGRYSDTPGNRTDPLYFGGSTVEETALSGPLINKPGEVFRYANNDTLAAMKAVRKALPTDPEVHLFDRLGMLHTVAEIDWQGDYVLSSQSGPPRATLSSWGNFT